MKDYNQETIKNLEDRLLNISKSISKPFSKKKILREEYIKLLNELQNLKANAKNIYKKMKKSVKKCQKVGQSGAKIKKNLK